MANELLDYFDNNLELTGYFASFMLLPHHHHHEKKVKKTPSGNNLVKMVSSANFQDLVSRKVENETLLSDTPVAPTMNKGLKYQYSFTDSIILDEFSNMTDFKVNLDQINARTCLNLSFNFNVKQK